MGDNNTLNFDLNHPASLLLYHPSLPSDLQRDINSSISGKTAEFLIDPPYEKTKAQRLLAKTTPTSTNNQPIEGDTISNAKTIPVSTIIPFNI
jgi:hypothetical protein